MAGGAGSRLWPLSRADKPKQILPLYEEGSLLSVAFNRQEGLIPPERRYLCAGLGYKNTILQSLPELGEERFLGEPVGRDTLNALGYSAAILHKEDPQAVMAVFTADHLIHPEDDFRNIIAAGYDAAEKTDALITFGITPTEAATGFGYLQLGDELIPGVKRLSNFREKPDQLTAESYLEAGAENYLWNSGMFVWKTSVLLKALKKYHPENYRMIMEIADAWGSDNFDSVRDEIFPKLIKISVDFAIMEPASRDEEFTVAALPMPLAWQDVGSWDAFAGSLENGMKGASVRSLLKDSPGTFGVSEDPEHLIAAVGCEDLVIVHTKKATLVCPRKDAQRVKELYEEIKENWNNEYI